MAWSCTYRRRQREPVSTILRLFPPLLSFFSTTTTTPTFSHLHPLYRFIIDSITMAPFDRKRKRKGKARQELYLQRERVSRSSSAPGNAGDNAQDYHKDPSVTTRDVGTLVSMAQEDDDIESVSDTSSELTPPPSEDERVSLPLLSSTSTRVKQQEGSSSS